MQFQFVLHDLGSRSGRRNREGNRRVNKGCFMANYRARFA